VLGWEVSDAGAGVGAGARGAGAATMVVEDMPRWCWVPAWRRAAMFAEDRSCWTGE
jgi:hypothetical protein